MSMWEFAMSGLNMRAKERFLCTKFLSSMILPLQYTEKFVPYPAANFLLDDLRSHFSTYTTCILPTSHVFPLLKWNISNGGALPWAP